MFRSSAMAGTLLQVALAQAHFDVALAELQRRRAAGEVPARTR